MKTKDLITKTAREQGISPEKARLEMQTALDEGLNNPGPKVQAE